MALDGGVADLHLHTLASDGTCSVDARVEQASDRNLAAIAITDHDIVAGDIGERVARRRGVELVAGVEVRADVRETKVELLGYYVDPSDERLASVLEQVRFYRRERNRAIVDRLHEVTEIEQTYEEIRSRADGLLGRPHIAEVLVEEGVVDSVGAAFEAYLATGGEAFVPMQRVRAVDVVGAIEGADGVVSLAHPGRLRTDDVEGIVGSLVEEGLDAIEVWYPYDSAPAEGYADVSVEDASALAEEFDLLRTGGSDCHGPGSGKYRIGEVRVPRSDFEALRDRATERRRL